MDTNRREENKTPSFKVKNIVLFVALVFFYATYIPPMIVLGTFSEVILRWSRYREKVIHMLKVLWLETTVALLGCYFRGETVVVYDEETLKKMSCYIISNHITNYDWIFLLRALHHLGKYKDLCIILKESLAHVPFFGYGMKMFGFIFLRRKLVCDKNALNDGLSKLRDKKVFSLLLFPEGTILNSVSHPKSLNYAEKIHQMYDERTFHFDEVLVPRITGYKIVNDVLFKKIRGIIDITLFFNPYKKYPQDSFSYKDIFFRDSVHFNFIFVFKFIKKNSRINEETFLYSLFDEKNTIIERYAKHFDHKNPIASAEFEALLSKVCTDKKKSIVKSITMWTSYSKYMLSFSFVLWLAIGAAVIFKVRSCTAQPKNTT